MLPFARQGVRVAAALIALLVGVSGSVVAAPTPAQAQALPPPLQFVSNLDLECFPTPPYQPPVPFAIVTQHLNPALANLPPEPTPLGLREQLCVPVVKNNTFPPAQVMQFVRFVDLACYRTTGQNVTFPLQLNHLNPLFANLPPHNVTILTPVQLCVPVMKNGVVPPAAIRRLVSFIDVKCYLETPQTPLNRTVGLTHINPVLANIPILGATITFNRQLCVPVRKNNQAIPADVLNIVRWIDLEKYDIVTPPLPISGPGPGTLALNHLNPLLANLPTEQVTLIQGRQLMLPVAKNGLIPPAG